VLRKEGVKEGRKEDGKEGFKIEKKTLGRMA
jgi:hypothetical protein